MSEDLIKRLRDAARSYIDHYLRDELETPESCGIDTAQHAMIVELDDAVQAFDADQTNTSPERVNETAKFEHVGDAVERAKLVENVQAWREHFSPDGKRIRLEGDNKAAICAVLDDVLAALSHDPQKEALLTAIDAWMADPSPATEQGIMDAREALSSTLSGGLDRD